MLVLRDLGIWEPRMRVVNTVRVSSEGWHAMGVVEVVEAMAEQR